MISGVSTTTLSQIYKQQTSDYTKVLETIAGGKKFNKPSDDFVAYTRTRSEESAMKGYERISEDLVKAKEAGTLASSVGNAAFERLSELKELAKNYATASDADKEILKEKFDAAKAAIKDSFTNNTYESKAITGSDIVSVQIDPNKPASKMSLTLENPATALDALDIEDADPDKLVDAALTAVAKYTAQAESFNSSVDRQLTINQNIMAAKENTISAVRDIDDIAAIGKATALEIRQQASISMIAQANVSQTSLIRLFS